VTPIHFVLLALAPVQLTAEATRATANDAELLQGVWKIISGEEEGQKQPVPPGVRWTFKGDKLIVKENEKLIGLGTCHLKVAKPANQMDGAAVPPDPQMGSTADLPKDMEIEKTPVLAIYRLSGNTLTICAAKPGKPRPKTFSTRKGDDSALIVLERIRPVD